MLYSGKIESISPINAVVPGRKNLRFGPGGYKCGCCTPFGLRSAKSKENKSRTHKRLNYQRINKPFWFE